MKNKDIEELIKLKKEVDSIKDKSSNLFVEKLSELLAIMNEFPELSSIKTINLEALGYDPDFTSVVVEYKNIMQQISKIEKAYLNNGVFISVSSKNEELGLLLSDFLESKGINTFIYTKNKSGDKYKDNINKKLKESPYFVNLITKEYMESTYCKIEFFTAYIIKDNAKYFTLSDFNNLGIESPLTDIQFSNLVELSEDEFYQEISDVFNFFNKEIPHEYVCNELLTKIKGGIH